MLETLVKNLIPPDDEERLEALRKFEILYTPLEETFDNITAIMAEVFNIPMAFISLVDKDKVFYKSQAGTFGRQQVDRADSLCSLTILNSVPLVIEDASAEACFDNNPLVMQKGGLRFYAGVPLITKEGFSIGAVCIVDTVSRTFSAKDTELLVRFGKMVMHEIEARFEILKRNEVRDELNKAQLQLSAALEVGKVTPWQVDLASGKVFGNTELAKMFNVDIEKAVNGLPLENFVRSIHPDDQPYFWNRYNQAIQQKTNFEAEYRVINTYKEEHWVIVRGSLQYKDNIPVLLTGSLIDITDKKNIEQELVIKNEELNNLYQELMFVTDTMPQLAWIRDKDGAPIYFNQRWVEYTDIKYEELFEKVHTLVHPDDVEKLSDEWTKARATEGKYELEYRLKKHDGTYNWFLGRGRALKDVDGNIIKWYGTSTDINQQKLASELLENEVRERTKELLEANNHLKRVNAEMEQFSYVSHHDLQESIRKIIIFTEMVRTNETATLQEGSKMRLAKVIAAAQRMNAALVDILNLASLSNKEQYSTVDLNKVVESVLVDLELVIEEKSAE
ncbi:MAG TPA: PAS domain-containing protein, partial [Segetibacter sp.]